MNKLKVSSALALIACLTVTNVACDGGNGGEVIINHDTTLLPAQYVELERFELSELEKQSVIQKGESSGSEGKINSKLAAGMTNTKQMRIVINDKSMYANIRSQILNVTNESFKTKYFVTNNSSGFNILNNKDFTCKTEDKTQKNTSTTSSSTYKAVVCRDGNGKDIEELMAPVVAEMNLYYDNLSDTKCKVKSESQSQNAYRAKIKLANESFDRMVNVVETITSAVSECDGGDLHFFTKEKKIFSENITHSVNKNEKEAHSIYNGMVYSVRGAKTLTMKGSLESLDMTDLN